MIIYKLILLLNLYGVIIFNNFNMTKCCICYNDKLCKYTNINCNICKNTIICNLCVLKSNSYNMLCKCKYFKKCPICNIKCMIVKI
jgi:hypothetical protein